MSRTRSKTVNSKLKQTVIVNGGTPVNSELTYDILSQVITDEVHPFNGDSPSVGNCTNIKLTRLAQGTLVHKQKHKNISSQTNHLSSESFVLSSILSLPVPGVTFTALNLTPQTDIAIQRAIAGLDASPYAFAEDLATMKQTIEFLRNPLKSLILLFTRMLKAVRSKNKRATLRAGKKVVKGIAAVWLEYRFALMPLVRSLWNALLAMFDALSEKQRRRDGFQRSRATVKVPVQEKRLVSGQGGHSWESFGTREGVAVACIYYRVSNPVAEAGWTYGLSMRDVPELMWDLFPYSFMIDRIADIGGMIRGFTVLNDPRVEVLVACKSTKITDKTVITLTRKQLLPDYVQTEFKPASVVSEQVTYVRTKFNPSVSMTVPTLQLGGLTKSTTNVLDLLALLTKLL